MLSQPSRLFATGLALGEMHSLILMGYPGPA
jgi:hypothetical protein